jgi:hypothetical protein
MFLGNSFVIDMYGHEGITPDRNYITSLAKTLFGTDPFHWYGMQRLGVVGQAASLSPRFSRKIRVADFIGESVRRAGIRIMIVAGTVSDHADLLKPMMPLLANPIEFRIGTGIAEQHCRDVLGSRLLNDG